MRTFLEKGRKPFLYLPILCLFIAAVAFMMLVPEAIQAQTPLIALQPGLALPTGPQYSEISETAYDPGMKISIRGQYFLGDSASFFAEGLSDIIILPLAGSGTENINFYSLGAGTGYIWRPGGPLSFQAMIGGGAYLATLNSTSESNFFGKALVGSSYTLSDSVDINLNADYSYYLTSSDTGFDNALDGFGITLGMSFRPQGGSSPAKLEIPLKNLPPLYPVMHAAYDTVPLGSLTLHNKESGPIENVEVYYHLPQYMDAPRLSTSVPRMERREEVVTDLYALLDKDILNETEGTAANAEITVNYTFRGMQKTYSENIRADILYRNALTWDDDRKAASFVTARDPAILTLARNSQNILRQHSNQSVDQPLRQGMTIYEMLRVFQLSYVVDPESSYKDLSAAGALDFLQFPVETLLYQAGDCDDLSVLYASLMEALSVETAFITVPGHIFTAFALDIPPEESRSVFPRSENDLIIRNGKLWMPVEVTLIESGDFLEAWRTGASQWKEYNDQGKAGFWPVREAWEVYKPVGLVASMENISTPDMNQVSSAFDKMITSYVQKEIRFRTMELEEEINESAGLARMKKVNSLGVLFARNGLYTDALRTLGPLVEGRNPYKPALLNMANLYYLTDKIDEAADLYRRSAELMPESAPALLGLALVEKKRGNTAAKEAAYRQLLAIAPEKAQKYAYLAEPESSTGRASGQSGKESLLWEDSE